MQHGMQHVMQPVAFVSVWEAVRMAFSPADLGELHVATRQPCLESVVAFTLLPAKRLQRNTIYIYIYIYTCFSRRHTCFLIYINNYIYVCYHVLGFVVGGCACSMF